MKVGVFTPVVGFMPLEEAVPYLASLGVEALEIGAGGTPGKQLDPEQLLGHKDKIQAVKDLMKNNNVEIAALSAHGNPVHPTKEYADRDHHEFMRAVELAEELEVDTIVGFSGCPGDCPTSQYPNWVTCTWPGDFPKILEYQWEILVDYWQKASAEAASHGIKKIAIEMHPGFCVYNPETMMKLREAVGPIMGANFDPSHLIWQQVNPVEAIRFLGEKGAIHHFHAKDTRINKPDCDINGVLCTGSYGDILTRPWVFRTIGYGSDVKAWKDMMSMLNAVGYDGIVSIEHEDGLMSAREGLEKAVEFLKSIIIKEKPGAMWWV